jgi:hypothetical protein
MELTALAEPDFAPDRAKGTTLFAQRVPHDTPACSRSADFMKPGS